MSRVARKSARRRIQPYAWLGAGAVTLGMGAAMVGGTAVAFAAPATDSASTASETTSSETSSAKREPAKTRATRGARASAVAEGDARPGEAGLSHDHSHHAKIMTTSRPAATTDL
jgi:hypothetical protein